jgi:thymidine kinase
MPAKLFLYYSAMDAGKSSTLLQASYNYRERGLRTLLFIPEVVGRPSIQSRIGLSAPAIPFSEDFDFLEYVRKELDGSPLHGASLL